MKSSTGKAGREFLVLIALTCMTGCVVYQENASNPHPPKAHHSPALSARGPSVNVTFTAQEREIIQTYVSDSGKQGKKHGKSLPPGLARKAASGNSLPPGWEKKLVRGEVMSMDLYRQCSPLPNDITLRLPPPPSGTVVVAIDGKVVRLARATMEILDVLEVGI